MRFQTAIEHRPVVLDGGLATTLEAAGHDLDTALWSARLLVEEPEAVVAVHEAFLDAGAQVLVTASYQASVGGFVAAGLSVADAEAAIRRSVELARQAIEQWRGRTGEQAPRWVAGSVGPCGAALADGSEYTGAYDLSASQLRDFHAPRIAQLVAADVDVLAIETQPRADEALVALELATSVGADAWVSFTTPDGTVLPDGTPLAQAATSAAAHGAIAVGVNCCTPAAAARAVAGLLDAPATIAYPNLGDRWDPEQGTWTDVQDTAVEVPAADLVGGCCGTSPADIAVLADQLRRRR